MRSLIALSLCAALSGCGTTAFYRGTGDEFGYEASRCANPKGGWSASYPEQFSVSISAKPCVDSVCGLLTITHKESTSVRFRVSGVASFDQDGSVVFVNLKDPNSDLRIEHNIEVPPQVDGSPAATYAFVIPRRAPERHKIWFPSGLVVDGKLTVPKPADLSLIRRDKDWPCL